MTRIYFIRHGESEANKNGRYAGWFDAPLTEQGVKQANLTAEFLKKVPFDAFYGSDLSRAYDTGCAVAALHSMPVTSCQALREIHAGVWEGRLIEEVMTCYPVEYALWKEHVGLCTFPDGESVAQLQQRVRNEVESIVHRHPGQTVCVATHATPIRVMEAVWNNVPLEKLDTIPWVANASVTIVEYDENGVGRLVERDLHDHLGALSTFVSAKL
ncbi:MAG: histidine phosphatase family protein [Clostridia bacterium]|nr:histidine phosphatase family protein [Clostridia bacterium]